jgi:hypothetical protein
MLFRVAAAWNIVAALAALALPGVYYRWAYGYEGRVDELLLTAHVGLWVIILLMGVGYALVSVDPAHNRALIWIGAIGKLLFAAIWTAQIVIWRGKLALLSGIIGDSAFALLFLRHLRRK